MTRGGYRPGAGRPGEGRTDRVTINLTLEEGAALDEARGETARAEWVRALVIDALGALTDGGEEID